jgi:hypothetical protein
MVHTHFDVPHVIEVTMRNENVRNIFGLNADLTQHFARRTPAPHAIGIRQHLAMRLVVVADIHHRKLALTLDHDVAIRQLARALVVHAVYQPAQRIIRNRGVFHHP